MIGFTSENGYVDGIVRGYRGALLTVQQYNNLCHCETADEVRNQLTATDYGDQMMMTKTQAGTNTPGDGLKDKLRAKFVDQFRYLRDNTAPESTARQILERIQYGYMIDNVVLLLAGTSNYPQSDEAQGGGDGKKEEDARQEREKELLRECHPLGQFDALGILAVGGMSPQEAHQLILQELPIGKYFTDLKTSRYELIREIVWKRYLEDFCAWSLRNLDSVSRKLMAYLLEREAERRTLAIAINSLKASLTKDERFELFPQIGLVHQNGLSYKLSRAEDYQSVKAIIEQHPLLSARFSVGLDREHDRFDINQEEDQSVNPFYSKFEECLAVEEVEDCKSVFEFPANYAVFYAWVRLKEQEARNIVWISKCISQQRKDNASEYIPIW